MAKLLYPWEHFEAIKQFQNHNLFKTWFRLLHFAMDDPVQSFDFLIQHAYLQLLLKKLVDKIVCPNLWVVFQHLVFQGIFETAQLELLWFQSRLSGKKIKSG